MARLKLALSALYCCLSLAGCSGAEDDDDAQRTESSQNCEDVCDFWAQCNSRELEPGACADHCDEQSSEVSEDCLDLYLAQTDCEADHLDCSDLLGTACQAEYDAYYDCEAEQ